MALESERWFRHIGMGGSRRSGTVAPLRRYTHYLAMGHTDLRRGIDGLAVIVQDHYGKEIKENDIFIFCGRRNDRIKALLWEGDGFLLLYKRLEKGSFRWPRKRSDLAEISSEQYRSLMRGLEIELNKIPRQKLAPRII